MADRLDCLADLVGDEVIEQVAATVGADLRAALTVERDEQGRARYDRMPSVVVRALAACPGPPPPAEAPDDRPVG